MLKAREGMHIGQWSDVLGSGCLHGFVVGSEATHPFLAALRQQCRAASSKTPINPRPGARIPRPAAAQGQTSTSASASEATAASAPRGAPPAGAARGPPQASTSAAAAGSSTAAPVSRLPSIAIASPADAASLLSRWLQPYKAIPSVPRFLGFAGAIPFLVLAPPVANKLHVLLPHDIAANSAMFQIAYGVSIISFLGAVHWGAAINSTLTGPIARQIAAERYTWGVMPALLAFPVALMQPAPASMALTVMLPAIYLVDKRFARRGYLPQWYMTLRGPLTLLATFGMLLTASYYYHLELLRLEQLDKQAQAAQQQQSQGGGSIATP